MLPFDEPIVAERHPPYYLMHKYWSRKPHNVVRSYIEHFSSPGEVVLDPFAGSGVTLVEALLSGRRAVAIDISPVASLITRATVLPFAPEALRAAFAELEHEVRPQIDAMFLAGCNACGLQTPAAYFVWERMLACPSCGNAIPLGRGRRVCVVCGQRVPTSSINAEGQRLVEVVLRCPVCRAIQRRPPTAEEQQRGAEAVAEGPRDGRMFVNERILAYQSMAVGDLFTPRNRRALALLIKAIEQVSQADTRTLLTFTFTASVAQASRLIAYRNGLSSGGPAWTVAGFWVPPRHVELNAWSCFSNRFRRLMRGKTLLAKLMCDAPYYPAASFAELAAGANGFIATASATDLKPLVPDESVDYIFTDPPYGDSVPYLEYATIWSAWLDVATDYTQEVVISDSRERGKDLADYRWRLGQAFAECARVLRPGRYLSLTFNNRHATVWDALHDAAAAAGFELVGRQYQAPAVVPAKTQLARAGSLVGDIILTFQKPNSRP